MISQGARSKLWFTLSPQSIAPVLYYNLLYVDLNFRTRSHLTENDVYVRIKPVDTSSGYIELVLTRNNKLINWIFSEDIQRYITRTVK
jgi:hypothetical protein